MTRHIPSHRELVRLLHRHGYERRQSRKHLRYCNDAGDCVTLAASPSDRRGIFQTLRDLRQKGIL